MSTTGVWEAANPSVCPGLRPNAQWTIAIYAAAHGLRDTVESPIYSKIL